MPFPFLPTESYFPHSISPEGEGDGVGHPAEPGPYQVFVGQPGDLVLQAGLDAGLGGQLQVLGQQLLLPVVLFLQVLDLPTEGFGLILMAPLL